MLIFAKNPVEKSKNAQRLEYNFLLKRKLAIDVSIKSVAQITSFHKSGQRALNSIPSSRHPQITEKMSKYRHRHLPEALDPQWTTFLIFFFLYNY